jgi:hypothetical protein
MAVEGVEEDLLESGDAFHFVNNTLPKNGNGTDRTTSRVGMVINS